MCLIFVSLAERYAEVVADSGINAKVAAADWDGVVAGLAAHASDDQLADGFVEAIGAVGDAAGRAFSGRRPATATNSTIIWWKSDLSHLNRGFRADRLCE